MGRHTVSVTLRRDGPRTPWGIRLVGGADLSAPLLITRAQAGSPADGRLRRGDIITKIAEYDARDLRHQDAQTLFQNAGNSISVVVQREGASLPGVGGSPLSRSMTQPLPVSPPTPTPFTAPRPPVAGGVATPFAAPRPPVAGGVATPFAQASTLPRAPQVTFPPPLPSENEPQDEDINAITHQPYRTTPLVLPGAKVKKDTPVATQSYLRHHPNPHFRAPPAPSATEVLMKQKVADTVIQKVVGEDAAGKQVVHKQFNSPIGLYSDQNIAETIQKQTGVTPKSIVRAPTLDRRNQVPVSMRKTVKYDPSQSETFKALQEEELGGHLQEVTVPVTPKVFNPSNRPNAVPEKPTWVKKPQPEQQRTFVNSLGNYEETIQQSGSFKRLMYQVLGQSDF